MPVAVTILPAVRLKAYHVLAGDSSFSRYIVVDVSNETEFDAELEYCGVRRMHVLPRETCRNNPQMQKEEVERLRLLLERHVTKHLDIRWDIAGQKLSGIVPMGALLSEVSFLKQLILPTITLEMCVAGRPYVSADEIPLRVGEITDLSIKIISSLSDAIGGTMSLMCEQEISSGLGLINKSDHLLVLGAKRRPFSIQPRSHDCPQPSTSLTFQFLFRVEGIFKITAQVASETSLRDDDVFGCVLTFAVTSKAY
ncbi:hypothetical protein WR25_11300 [Diploscapter pachys]|uniref:Uncharacterized protein n=1 Tax=Diploscapter pachys TaxID=2018661 RepID=A0A2A2K8J3_9BILA|nr:hypothetical protein WR25_11300 [Diploscapter pachys]